MKPCLLALAFSLAGCPAPVEDVRPPIDQFFFPTAIALAPDDSSLFVVNANAELRFSSGSVTAIDLDRVDALFEGFLATGAAPGDADCDLDVSRPDILQCNEREVIRPDSSVRIGNFASAVGLQELASGALRLFVPVRGDPSVTWIDVLADGRLDCDDAEAFQQCGDARRLTSFRDDPELPVLPDEPFGVFVDSGNEYAMVTHLSNPTVTLVDAPADGRAPVLSDAISGLFRADQSGFAGAVGAAGRAPGTPGDLVYITSRSEPRVQMMYAARPADDGLARLVASEFFFVGTDSRGIAFGSGGDLGYIVNRDPGFLFVLDTSLGATGFPANELIREIELCSDASNLAIADVGRGERAYVGCFPAGQVWVVDGKLGRFEAIVDVGRGPHAVAVSETRQKMYVANFLEDTIAVIDLTPGAPTENRYVLSLGRPRQQGGN